MTETSSMSGDLEVDFDKNPSHLYMLIHEQDWEGVKYEVTHFPEEAKIFVFRKDKKTGLLKWRILPIHAALLSDAPLETLQLLLTAYPLSAQLKDDHQMLPVHLAVKKHRDPETINLFLAAYPDCISVKNHYGLTPFQMAETSSSPHKSYYLRALKRGSVHSTITGSMSDLVCGLDLSEIPVFDIKDARALLPKEFGVFAECMDGKESADTDMLEIEKE